VLALFLLAADGPPAARGLPGRGLRLVLHELEVEANRHVVADGGARLDELVPGEPVFPSADLGGRREAAARLAELVARTFFMGLFLLVRGV